MLNPKSIQCVDPALYKTQGTSFEEGRALLLSRYMENELDSGLTNRIREHLDCCACCTQWIRNLDQMAELKLSDSPVLYASCPSTAHLDQFTFDRSSLPSAETKRIEQHLEECPLCKEEVDWVRNLEEPEVIPLQVPRRNWTQHIAIAAALFFMILSGALLLRKSDPRAVQHELSAIAVIKQPQDIDYASLKETSVALPQGLERTYDDAVNLVRESNYKQAASLLERVRKEIPSHAGTMYLLGYSYYHLNEPQKAFELCDRAEQMRPHSLERCLSLVHIALKTGHYDRAMQEISGLYHEAPDHPEIKALYHRIESITRGKVLS